MRANISTAHNDVTKYIYDFQDTKMIYFASDNITKFFEKVQL